MAKGASGRTSSDYRKLRNMLEDLRKMKAELIPDERDKALEAERAGMDSFQKAKADLNYLLSNVRTDVERLNTMRKNLGDDGRDTMTIRLSSDNTRRLAEATQLFLQLKDIQTKDEKKKSKKLSPKDMEDRRQMIMLIGEEIKQLTNENARVKVSTSEEEQAIADRVAKRRAREDEARARREAARKKRGRKNKDDIDESDFKDVGPKSEQEQAFDTQVHLNMQEQDKILEEISKGLDDLKELATEAHKHLTTQQIMLDQVDSKMDETITQFKASNRRLKTLLEESGGMSRWCPMMICAIFLLALLGYIFGAVK